jgi:hypothetical protein
MVECVKSIKEKRFSVSFDGRKYGCQLHASCQDIKKRKRFFTHRKIFAGWYKERIASIHKNTTSNLVVSRRLQRLSHSDATGIGNWTEENLSVHCARESTKT